MTAKAAALCIFAYTVYSLRRINTRTWMGSMPPLIRGRCERGCIINDTFVGERRPLWERPWLLLGLQLLNNFWKDRLFVFRYFLSGNSCERQSSFILIFFFLLLQFFFFPLLIRIKDYKSQRETWLFHFAY